MKARRRTAGIVFLLVFTLLIWLSIASYDKKFTPVAMVTLYANAVGNELHEHAEVKARGVVVGEVRQISSAGNGARLDLAIQPDMVQKLPANVSAELLPTSLFGERYVDLILPDHPDPNRLVAGSVIGESRSAVELEKVFDDLLPILQDIQPQKLSVTLSALSQALDGRGAELGATLVRLNSYLQQLSPDLPTLDDDIARFASVANSYDLAAPDIVGALSDLTVTTKTVAAQRDQLTQLYGTVTGAATDLTSFLQANGDNVIRLSTDSRSTLQLLARYSPEFPCVLRQLTAFEPAMDAALGKGSNQHGLHVTLQAVPATGKYQPGRDTPAYHDDAGPRCPATTAADVTAPSTQNELINELIAPTVGTTPSALPGWSGELLGPLFRGTEVTVK